jgi:hypothetical protein
MNVNQDCPGTQKNIKSGRRDLEKMRHSGFFAEVPGPIRLERFRVDMFVGPRARICKTFREPSN